MPDWKFDSSAEERFKKIVAVPSPTSDEVQMGDYLRERWKGCGPDVSTDVLGNVCASLKGREPIHIGLAAHMDTVALQVTRITSGGMLLFRSIGLSPHVLLGQPVDLITGRGTIPGVIGFDPTSQYGAPKGLVEEDLWIDIAAAGAEQAGALVSVGDFAVLRPVYSRLTDTRIGCAGIDDKVGIFIMEECMRHFAEKGAPLHLHAIASVQEEIGRRGSVIAAGKLELDACFILDVDYATDTPTPHENQLGELLLGKGAGTNRKADNNIVLQRIVRQVAENNSIPFQVSPGRQFYGGTDAASFQLQRTGIATININIPCRYMHSPVEVCDTRDIEAAVNLLIATVEHIAATGQKSFLPGID